MAHGAGEISLKQWIIRALERGGMDHDVAATVPSPGLLALLKTACRGNTDAFLCEIDAKEWAKIWDNHLSQFESIEWIHVVPMLEDIRNSVVAYNNAYEHNDNVVAKPIVWIDTLLSEGPPGDDDEDS